MLSSFDATMFPDTVLIQAATSTTSARGGRNDTWATPGTSTPAYVETGTDPVSRRDQVQAQPRAVAGYRVFTGSDPVVVADDHIAWGALTLAVQGPAKRQGPLWMTDCLEAR